MQSKAKTVAQYLQELSAERREAIQAVRDVILANLDDGYEEGMQYGMISYYVPHRIYPAGYHCDPRQPLPFACLASQKNYLSLYMMGCYGEGNPNLEWFQQAWAKTGKKLEMGKACIRFRKAEDLALDVIGEVIRRMPVDEWIKTYETTLRDKPQSSTTKQATKSSPSKKVPAKKKSAKPSIVARKK